MSLFENTLVNCGVHGAVGASAGAHLARFVGESKMMRTAAVGGGTGIGVYLADNQLIKSAIAGGLGCIGPLAAEKLGKSDATKAAVITAFGAAAGVAADFISAKFLG